MTPEERKDLQDAYDFVKKEMKNCEDGINGISDFEDCDGLDQALYDLSETVVELLGDTERVLNPYVKPNNPKYPDDAYDDAMGVVQEMNIEYRKDLTRIFSWDETERVIELKCLKNEYEVVDYLYSLEIFFAVDYHPKTGQLVALVLERDYKKHIENTEESKQYVEFLLRMQNVNNILPHAQFDL